MSSEFKQIIVNERANRLRAYAFIEGRVDEQMPWEALADNDNTDLEVYGTVRTFKS